MNRREFFYMVDINGAGIVTPLSVHAALNALGKGGGEDMVSLDDIVFVFEKVKSAAVTLVTNEQTGELEYDPTEIELDLQGWLDAITVYDF
jgi:hypothetical protein